MWRAITSRKEIRFLLVGAFNTALIYSVYVALVYFGMHYNLALLLDYIIGIALGYHLNKNYTFTKDIEAKESPSLGKYVISYVVVFALNLLLLNLFVQLGWMGAIIAQLVAVIIATLCSFVLQDKWVFGEITAESKHD